MSYLESALYWARKGVRVLPLREKGKTPKLKSWQTLATTSEGQVREWWTQWPDANIGGIADKFIIVDCDGESAVDYMKGQQFPQTYMVTRGGHRHYYFKQPFISIKNSIKIRPDMDLISQVDEKGHYIVLPPSLHPSGDRYTENMPFSWDSVKPLPNFIIDLYVEASKAKKEEKKARIVEPGAILQIPRGERHETLKEVASRLRNIGLGYNAILQALLAVNQESCSPPESDTKALADLAEWAASLSSSEIEKQAEIKLGGEMADAILKNYQLQRAAEMGVDKTAIAGPCPDSFMPPSGLIARTAQYILDNSIYPQPLMAVIGASCMVAALCGRKWETKTGLRANLYAVSLAPSGAGKDKARKVVKSLLGDSGFSRLLGGEDIASGAGVFNAMVENPVQLFMIDEFGYFLQAVTGKNAAGYKREIMTVLMRLYSSADTIVKGAEYSDKKNRPTAIVHHPCAIIYGTSTHRQFFDAFTSSEAVSGQLARLMVFPTPDEIPDIAGYRETFSPPDELITEIQQAGNAGAGNIVNATSGELGSHSQKVREAEEIKKLWFELSVAMQKMGKDDASRSIYNRVAENTMKLALVYAFSINPQDPYIDQKAFDWGRDMALWSANSLMEQYNRYSSDTEVERQAKEVEEFIRTHGSDGIPPSVLDRRFAKKYRSQDWSSLLSQLHLSGSILRVEQKTNGAGRPAVRIVHFDHFDQDKHTPKTV